MDLEKGMYVRTYKGIRKIVEVVEDNNYYIDKTYINDFRQEINCITNSCIIGQPSYNIIDLIEVGDYVNGYKIYSIYDDDKYVNEYNLKHKKCLGKNIYDEDYQEYLIYEEDIESIVTKEQFEAMKYEIK